MGNYHDESRVDLLSFFHRDVLCGLLQCGHFSERLLFGLESAATLSQSFLNDRHKILSCRTALIDSGLDQIDPGLVPNGAKCGEGKVRSNLD